MWIGRSIKLLWTITLRGSNVPCLKISQDVVRCPRHQPAMFDYWKVPIGTPSFSIGKSSENDWEWGCAWNYNGNRTLQQSGMQLSSCMGLDLLHPLMGILMGNQYKSKWKWMTTAQGQGNSSRDHDTFELMLRDLKSYRFTEPLALKPDRNHQEMEGFAPKTHRY